jgi:hypothetical protein
MRADTLFPSTHATWMTVQLDAVDRGDATAADRALRELRDHVLIDEFRRCNDPPLNSLDTVLEPGALGGERVTSGWVDRRFVHDTMTLGPVNAALVPRPPRDVL